MSILKPKGSNNTKTLSIRVPAELHAQIELVRKQADAAGLALDVSSLLTDTLAKAIKTAAAELAAKGEARAPALKPSQPAAAA